MLLWVKYGDPKTIVFPLLQPMRYEDVSWDAKENWALSAPSNWRVCIGLDYRI